MAAHQVIYTHGGGRLGNQVLRFVHWIAWARTQPDCEVLDLAFWPHARHFAAWRGHPGCVFPPRAGRPDRWARALAALPARLADPLHANNRFLRLVQAAGGRWPGAQARNLDITREDSLDLTDPAFLAAVRSRPLTFLSGWRIAAWPLVAAQEAALRPWFAAAPEVAATADDTLRRLRSGADCVLGVFLRHSDYRSWHDGRFFFPVARYAAWMRELVELHPGRRVAFLVASDVAHDPAEFRGLPVTFSTGSPNRGGPAIASWAELARCDAVVSPPSTFSATAAFAGGRPVWPLGAADQRLAADQVVAGGLAALARHPVFSAAVK